MSFSVSPERINPEQRAAITAVDGPSLVIAGPGSGKTLRLEGQEISGRGRLKLTAVEVTAEPQVPLTALDIGPDELLPQLGGAAVALQIGGAQETLHLVQAPRLEGILSLPQREPAESEHV